MFKNALLILLALTLGTSLVLNYFFYQKAFIPLQLAKLDPVGIGYYPELKTQEKSENKPSIMFYGDSRALSWAPFKTTDYQFINRAIGNQTSTQILQRFDKHVAIHQPDLILVQMCVNDLKMIPTFPNKRDSIIQNCKDNIQALIQKARRLESTVVLSTVFPLGDISIFRKALGITEAPIIDGIAQINAFINAQVAEDVVIFDSYTLLAGSSAKINPAYSRDWLHLNEQGYALLNKHLQGFLAKTIKNP
ncbi:MAG: SGNH/GDSL hydrolase family protein [Leucothrix sp.]